MASADPKAAVGAGTPSSATALAEAERAYEAGDYLRARRLCSPLADLPDSAEASTREGAAALMRRLAADRVQLAVLLACALFFLIVVVAYSI